MMEQSEKWDRQWSDLLTHAYGEVHADPAFKADLLTSLNMRTAENRTPREEKDAVNDEQWSTFLTSAYVPCEPKSEFKSHLLSQLKARQTQLTGPVRTEAEDQALMKILKSTYTPIAPRREFQTRLLENLKQRQRHTTIIRRSNRRRTIFMSALSGMAAAAAILFIMTVSPVNPSRPSSVQPLPPPMLVASEAQAPAGETIFASADVSNTIAENIVPAVASGLAFASAGRYRVADAFQEAPLPRQVLGSGMEVNYGEGWESMDDKGLVPFSPGMAFRPAADAEARAGLGFGKNSVILMGRDSLIEATENGLAVRRGTMAFELGQDSERLLINFPERDIVVEPGTMLAVSMEAPENYAEGGAPAPVVRVLDGGFAVAKGKAGSGALLANRVYAIDNYVTPDLPGRPLCERECQDLERTLQAASFASDGAQESRLVSPTRFASTTATPQGFVKKGLRWVAKDYEDQPTVRIQYLSDDYFCLANERRDLASALALGSDVVIDGGDGLFYEIYKK